MKKRATLAIVVSLVAILAAFALSACGGGKQEAIDAYRQASENYSTASDMALDANLDATVEMSGQTLFDIDGTTKLQYKLPEDLVAAGITTDLEKIEDLLAVIDRVELAATFEGTLSAMDSGTASMMMGIYLTDGKMYLDMVVPDEEPMKIYYEITPEMKQEIVDSYNEMMAESGSESTNLQALKEKFKLENYVKDGSFSGGNLEMTFDLLKMLNDVMAAAAAESDAEVGSLMQYAEMIDDAISNGDLHFKATLSDDMYFKSMNYSMDTEIDLGKLYASSTGTDTGSDMPTGSSGDSYAMNIKFNLDCPKIEINTGQEVVFPSFKDYMNVTEEALADAGVEADKTDDAASAADTSAATQENESDYTAEELKAFIEEGQKNGEIDDDMMKILEELYGDGKGGIDYNKMAEEYNSAGGDTLADV